MPLSTSTTQNVARSTNVTIERLDDLAHKVRADHQLQSLRRLSCWGIVCLMVNTIYFAYRLKCSLETRSNLPLANIIIAWVFLGLEMSLACKYQPITYLSDFYELQHGR